MVHQPEAGLDCSMKPASLSAGMACKTCLLTTGLAVKCRGCGILKGCEAARSQGESEQTLMCREIAEQSSDDEEHFRHKERRRLARDRAKLNPLILGTSFINCMR